MRLCVLGVVCASLLLVGCLEPDFQEECLVNSDCPEGMQCPAANCVPLEDCPEDNQTRCGDQCVVISGDVNHCGSCDPCPALANARALSCIQGQCQYECEAGYRDVDGDLPRAPLGTGCECPPGEACDTCADACGDQEVCRDGRCVQVECVDDAPCALPAPACDGDSVMSWVGTGACVDNACDRQLALTPCGPEQLCQDGACVDTDCTEDRDCATPTPSCQGDTLLTYDGPLGRCEAGACDFSQVSREQDCALLEQRCQEGACVDPCAQVVCDAPEQPYCEGNTRVVPVSNTCQWETGQCLVQEERQDCPDRCHRGHCMPGNTVVILAGEIKHAWGDSGPARATNTISRPFLMHQAEVTRQEYRLLINQDPSVTRTSDLIPVNNVTWLEAVLFSIELNNIQRLDVCYTRSGQALYEPISDCPGWRLPTLLEFQHAQRAGATTIFSCGEEAQCLEGTAHCGPDTGYAQVRQLLPNAWGLYDITGNVAEWTHDWYGEVPTQDTVDWDGPRGGQRRYLAGGYAGDSASFCAVFARRLLSPEDTGPEAGFRLVRTLHPAP